jgi:hypothetical protein
MFLPPIMESINGTLANTTTNVDINVNPPGPLAGIYIISIVYTIFLLLVQYTVLNEDEIDAGLNAPYIVYLAMNVVSLTASSLATWCSDRTFGDPVKQNLWGAHLNLGTDIVTVVSSIASLFYVKLPCCYFPSAISVLVAILGLFSSVASLDGVRETGFGKTLEGWVVGAVCLAVGGILFIAQEVFNMIASS